MNKASVCVVLVPGSKWLSVPFTDRIAGAASEINALKDAFNRGKAVLGAVCKLY